MNNKKIVCIALIALLFALCFSAEAQQTKKVPRIGFLGNSTPALEENLIGPFRKDCVSLVMWMEKIS